MVHNGRLQLISWLKTRVGFLQGAHCKMQAYTRGSGAVTALYLPARLSVLSSWLSPRCCLPYPPACRRCVGTTFMLVVGGCASCTQADMTGEGSIAAPWLPVRQGRPQQGLSSAVRRTVRLCQHTCTACSGCDVLRRACSSTSQFQRRNPW